MISVNRILMHERQNCGSVKSEQPLIKRPHRKVSTLKLDLPMMARGRQFLATFAISKAAVDKC